MSSGLLYFFEQFFRSLQPLLDVPIILHFLYILCFLQGDKGASFLSITTLRPISAPGSGHSGSLPPMVPLKQAMEDTRSQAGQQVVVTEEADPWDAFHAVQQISPPSCTGKQLQYQTEDPEIGQGLDQPQ